MEVTGFYDCHSFLVLFFVFNYVVSNVSHFVTYYYLVRYFDPRKTV